MRNGTVAYWLYRIADQTIRNKAVINARFLKSGKFDDNVHTYSKLSYALLAAFEWDKSQERFDYWSDILVKIIKQEANEPTNKN